MIVEPRTVWTGKSIVRLDNELAEAEQAPEWIREIWGVSRPDHEDRATVRTLAVEPGSVGIECEAVGPPSAVGRTVWVVIPPEQVLAVLKLCRRAAAHVRSEPMGGASKPS